MTAQFRIIFTGNVLPGFEPAAVKLAAEGKLKANAEQVERLFSGKRAVLKKNLPDDKAQHYVAVMRRIGMDVFSEEESELAPIELAPMEPRHEPAPTAPQPGFDPVKTQIAHMASSPVTLKNEAYDPERTELADPAMVSGYADDGSVDDLPPPVDEPDLDKTLIVSPSTAAQLKASAMLSTDQTILVKPGAAIPPAPAGNPMDSDKTLVVSPAMMADYMRKQQADAQTMIVNKNDVMPENLREGADASHEATMIVPPDMVASYMKQQQAAAVAAPAPAMAHTPAPAPVPKPPKQGNDRVGMYVVAVILVVAIGLTVYALMR